MKKIQKFKPNNLFLVMMITAFFVLFTVSLKASAQQTGVIQGVVTRFDAPIENAVIRVDSRPGTTDSAYTNSDLDGFYMVTISIGEYKVTCRLSSGAALYYIVQLFENETTITDFSFTPGAVTGNVKKNNIPVENAVIRLNPKPGTIGSAYATTNVSGYYNTETQPGDYRIVATLSSGASFAEDLTVTEAQTFVVNFDF